MPHALVNHLIRISHSSYIIAKKKPDNSGWSVSSIQSSYRIVVEKKPDRVRFLFYAVCIRCLIMSDSVL